MSQPSLDHTAPEMQLALDEAMLLATDAGEIPPGFRTWTFDLPTLVLGRSSKVALEADRDFCDSEGISIQRRCSGGASIVGGPGCLMYSVIISMNEHPQAAKIDGAHRFVMDRLLSAVRRQQPDTRQQGICDLTWNEQKFSGNALRMARGHVLYHGTILHAADLALIDRCLNFAPRQPDYRRGRDHRSFLTNIPLDPQRLAADLADQFGVPAGDLAGPVICRAESLVEQRYSRNEWRFRH
ncbi:lipoate--protein ligase family protein [Roseiconus nitratireducens]|uniref:Lipoate--protein ligase family protein n=1 Tax=Roseiconus nitratireducens TaxID=2605748 RepID=A0A5M6D0Q9_9BACT|nr:lipoate--protein ligase family protein [Roseiconus nitratireducens]KAA5538745.1 lipoate--protein ligase family protein [Roseiconus nitratireducens]